MKKLISLFLTLIMIISSVGVAYASEQEDKKVLEGVKQLLDIGQYEKFDYSISNEDDIIYYFNWSDNEKGLLNVHSDADSNIYYYYKEEEPVSDDKITEQQAKQIADDFLKKVSKEYSYYKYNEESVEYGKGLRYIQFTYEPFINNHKVLECDAKITVDVLLGEVTEYYANLPEYDLNIQPESDAIGIEKAKSKLLADENLKLEYIPNYKSDKVVYEPAYTMDEYRVDAFTGEYLYDDIEADLAGESALYDDAAVAKDRGLNDIEKKEIANLNQKLSVDKAIQTIEQKFKIKVKYKEDIESNYYKDGKYMLSLNVNNVDDDYYFGCTIDEDGVVHGLYTNDIALSGEQAIKNYAKSIFPETDIPDNIKESSEHYGETPIYYDSYFYNKRNGIIDRASCLSITYDNDYKAFNIYYSYCTDEYINLEQRLTKDEVWNIINDVLPCEMFYIPVENKLKLCYGFEDDYFYVNAIDKTVVDYWGEEYEKDSNYTDIEGKWYEDIVKILKKYGYEFEGNEFKGSQKVTGRDVCEFMLSEQPEEYAKHSWNGDMYAEFAKNPDKEVTRYDMAKLMAKRKVDEVLLEKGRFERPFNDVTDDNINYVAVCKAYDIVKSDKDTFNGDNIITRAEMAAMQYYYMF